MNAEQKLLDWGFVARWVAITTVTFLVATAVAFAAMWSIGGPLLDSLSAPVAALLSGAWVGALMGLGIGLAQWSLLRHRLPNAAAWVAVTVVAFLPVALLTYNSSEGNEGLVLLAMGLGVAAITGLSALWLFGGARPAIAGQLGVILAVGLLLAACGGAAEPVVRFAEPRDGASVAAPVRVVMAAENFTVEPAGDGAVHDGAGHLHIMVDTPCVEAGETIPKDETHLHFGDGHTETDLELAPGAHTLCLQAADGAHTALSGQGMTHTITVTVP